MQAISSTLANWRATIRVFAQAKVIALLFLGFSAGVPLLLIFSSLSLWLREAGIERSAVTYFSWAALAYSFKFVWAPLIDRVPVPWLTHLLGRRRAWMLVSQFSIMLAIVWMANTDPALGGSALTTMAMAAVMLGFSSATQDIAIDAYRIESAATELQALMSATYVAGYRIGMLVAGAGALYLASFYGSESGAYSYAAWQATYLTMAMVMWVGIVTTILIVEPKVVENLPQQDQAGLRQYVSLLVTFVLAVGAFITSFVLTSAWSSSALAEGAPVVGFLVEVARFSVACVATVFVALVLVRVNFLPRELLLATYVMPVREFFARYGVGIAWLLLSLIAFYRISDIVLGVIANVFYQDLGFSKIEIANIVKTFGLAMTIVGGFAGGVLAHRFGVMRILFVGALLTVVTNLLFIALAVVGRDELLLYAVISADNLTAGLASAAFIAFLSSLTSVRFTAVQYAIFSSLMTLLPKVLGGYSGTVVDNFGYVNFFIAAALIGLPALVLVWLVNQRVEIQELSQLDR